MPVDVVASKPHYLSHVLPVWQALPEDCRGGIYAPGSKGVIALAARHGITASSQYPPKSTDPVVMAGGNDLSFCRGRPVVLLEHGAGQCYSGLDDPAHAGGRDRDSVALFCHPREETAARDRIRYPHAQVEVVGCPRLDRFHFALRESRIANRESSGNGAGFPEVPHYEGVQPATSGSTFPETPRVGIAWHWPADTVGIPEARWAWPHYERLALELLALRFDMVGHAHPRAWGWLQSAYLTTGIPAEPDADRFFDRIDVLIADNTSLLPEYASATGKPVVFLNAPWYRRDVEHGGRFWEWEKFVGSVDSPEELLGWSAPVGVHRSLALADHVYAHNDGHASQRAADAIVGWVDAL